VSRALDAVGIRTGLVGVGGRVSVFGGLDDGVVTVLDLADRNLEVAMVLAVVVVGLMILASLEKGLNWCS
jgi:hypothetical protein